MVLFLSLLLNYLPIYNFLNSKLYIAFQLEPILVSVNEAEYLIENYGDRGGCYSSRP